MKKKIFFSYTDNEPIENVKLIQAVKLHFSRLSNNADLIFNEQQFAMQADENKIISILNESDCNIHLLSVNYANEDKCMNQFKVSVENNIQSFPILLSSFYWDRDSLFEKVETQILPAKDKPLETQPNINVALTNIVKRVAQEGLGVKSSNDNTQRYYYLLASVVVLAGIIATVWATFHLSILVAGITFLMFLSIALIVIIKIWKPTTISLFKF